MVHMKTPDERLSLGPCLVYAFLSAALCSIGGHILMGDQPSQWLFATGIALVVGGASAIGAAVVGYMPAWLAVLIEAAMMR